MKTIVTMTLTLVALACGCAQTPKLSPSEASIVLARNVVKGKGASGISDVFTYEGLIYVYVTFKWEPVTRNGGTQTIEVRWFNGEKEISRREYQAEMGRPPHYVWFSTQGTALGEGPCRVKVYANGRYVGERAFSVVEKKS